MTRILCTTQRLSDTSAEIQLTANGLEPPMEARMF